MNTYRSFLASCRATFATICLLACTMLACTPQHNPDRSKENAVQVKQAVTVNYPFGTLSSFPGFLGCPTCNTVAEADRSYATRVADIKSFYDNWKAHWLKTFPSTSPKVDMRGKRYVSCDNMQGSCDFSNGVEGAACSEAMGYGMMFTVMMAGYDANAKTYFDSLNYTRKKFIDGSSLMSWCIPENGDYSESNQGPATDGDMDAADALIRAYYQWGGDAYLTEAKAIIAGMKKTYITYQKCTTTSDCSNGGTCSSGKCSVTSYFPRMNPGWSGSSARPESKNYLTRPSDYMVSHFKEFAVATGDSTWNTIRTNSTNILSKLQTTSSPNTGLIPDFVVSATPEPSTTGTGDEWVDYDAFDYNACRVPMRLAADVAMYGNSASKTILDKLVTWLKTGNAPTWQHKGLPDTATVTQPIISSAPGSTVGDHPEYMTVGYKMDGTRAGLTGRKEGGVYQYEHFYDPCFYAGATSAAIVKDTTYNAFRKNGWLAMRWAAQTDPDIDCVNEPQTTAEAAKHCFPKKWEYYGASISLMNMLITNGHFWVPGAPPPCAAKTCLSYGTGTCGAVTNGCGSTLDCGSCSGGQVCDARHKCVTPVATGNVSCTEDSYVWSSTGDSDGNGVADNMQNYGTSYERVKNSTSDTTDRISFLKFNLAGYTNVTSAYLHLVLKSMNTENTSNVVISPKATTDTWKENTITWANSTKSFAPVTKVDGTASSVTIADGSGDGTPITIDVTGAAKAAAQGTTGYLSLALVDDSATGRLIDFYGRHLSNSANWPYISINAQNKPSTTYAECDISSYVSEAAPTTNYGNTTSLYVLGDSDGSNEKDAVLKFVVGHLMESQFKTATLQFTVSSIGNENVDAVPVDVYVNYTDDWTETGLNWNNKPSNDNPVGTVSVSSSGTFSIDVTDEVKGAAASGQVTVILRSNQPSGRTVTINSDDNTGTKPKIILTWP